ncbi:hypothetical protein [Paenibacillus lemnae]|uniref:Uncharacterized protein n=1 Tax=Paenibacillus lemnae TaxID=1330551 RepID=A0A848M9R6_PAELE|nr:hypothetical protein [Paenibacillus lemnae]NMO97988.1 hypothetical protein [Paenibacillus lemnae]
MADQGNKHESNDSRDSQENIQEQQNQFRNFVEDVSKGGGYSENSGVNEDKARIPDNQNRMVDKHNLRK